MKSVILATLALAQLSFGAYTECDMYTTSECSTDSSCYLASAGCRANCTRILFSPGRVPNECEAATGCDAVIDDNLGEARQPCSFKDIGTTSSTSTPSTTSSETSTTSGSQSSTTADSQSSTTSDSQSSTTSDSESSSTTTSGDNGGNGECDGSNRELPFGPSSYQCGDHNLGQPEERCIYIDASSTCTGTNFGECGDADKPWPTFQSALDSLNGETVVLIVKAGTYSGDGNVNIVSPNINNLNEYVYLNIFSESGSDETIIDCKGEGFGFHFYQTTIRMDGFTVTNCVAPKRISFHLPSYATNQYIKSAQDTGRLGGGFFLDRTFITMNDMVIVNNGGEYGGGIFQYQNSIRMNNSIVEYNCATNSGGGIFLLFANLYMWNSYVSCNSADVFGGGIFGHQQRTDIIDNALVADNEAEYADELFCDQTTVNVYSQKNGAIHDNDVLSWDDNAVTYCCCNNCAFYNEDRSIDFCAASDNSKVTVDLSLAVDQGECTAPVDDATTTTASGGSSGASSTASATSDASSTASATSDASSTAAASSTDGTGTDPNSNGVESYNLLLVVSFIGFIAMFS